MHGATMKIVLTEFYPIQNMPVWIVRCFIMQWLRFWSSRIMFVLLAEIDSVLGFYLEFCCCGYGAA